MGDFKLLWSIAASGSMCLKHCFFVVFFLPQYQPHILACLEGSRWRKVWRKGVDGGRYGGRYGGREWMEEGMEESMEEGSGWREREGA